MINPFADVNWQPDREARRDFGRSWMVGGPVLGAVFAGVVWVKTGAWAAWPLWFAVGGFSLGLLCWAVPTVARPFYVVWYAVGGAIGFVVSNALLIAIFYLVITPIGLGLRVFGKDPLQRRWDRAAKSYWEPAEAEVDARRYFRQF